jgi:hypothetical protein
MDNRDLDRKVAEKLGWTDIRYSMGTYTRVGFAPIGCQMVLPSWESDANLALELWCVTWTLSKRNTGIWCLATRSDYYEAPTPAEAICQAFLKDNE